MAKHIRNIDTRPRAPHVSHDTLRSTVDVAHDGWRHYYVDEDKLNYAYDLAYASLKYPTKTIRKITGNLLQRLVAVDYDVTVDILADDFQEPKKLTPSEIASQIMLAQHDEYKSHSRAEGYLYGAKAALGAYAIVCVAMNIVDISTAHYAPYPDVQGTRSILSDQVADYMSQATGSYKNVHCIEEGLGEKVVNKNTYKVAGQVHFRPAKISLPLTGVNVTLYYPERDEYYLSEFVCKDLDELVTSSDLQTEVAFNGLNALYYALHEYEHTRGVAGEQAASCGALARLPDAIKNLSLYRLSEDDKLSKDLIEYAVAAEMDEIGGEYSSKNC
jgi:hypothetical protein